MSLDPKVRKRANISEAVLPNKASKTIETPTAREQSGIHVSGSIALLSQADVFVPRTVVYKNSWACSLCKSCVQNLAGDEVPEPLAGNHRKGRRATAQYVLLAFKHQAWDRVTTIYWSCYVVIF